MKNIFEMKEQERQMMKMKEKAMRERIATDMLRLLTHKSDEGLTWQSSKTDLMEMTHILFCTDLVRDAEGLPMTFRELVSRVCQIVHVVPPCNPYHLVGRAQIRKGRKMLPLFERYKGLPIINK